jgi:hypothetical protein
MKKCLDSGLDKESEFRTEYTGIVIPHSTRRQACCEDAVSSVYHGISHDKHKVKMPKAF